MDFNTFLENFDAIAEAPGGIPKLRSLILDRGVRGKLVPQNPEDEPAVVLVKRIRDLRTQSGRKAKPSSLSSNEKIDLPKLPESWDWCRVEQIATVCLGSTPSRKEPAYWDGHIPWVSSGEVANCRIKNTKERITKLGIENSSTTIYPKETVLIAIIGQVKTRGQSAILDIEACTNQNVAGLVFDAGNMLPDYVWKWALSEYEQTRSGSRGGAQPALNGQKIRDLLIPVPPLAEQKRIVAKVDELMVLCDRYEAAKQTRDNLRQKLRGSAIASLMNAETDEELDAAWAFVRDNWCHISQHSEDIDSLRKSVVELAIRGKLAPQNSEDEPASIILEKIQFEKEQLRRNKQTKLDKALPKIERDTLLFEAPLGWEWCYITNISQKVTDGEHITPQRSSSGYYLLSARNVRDEGIVLDDVDYVAEDENLRIRKRCDPDKGDILISCSGSVGRVTVVDKDKAYVMVRSVAVIKPFQSYLFSKYLAYALRAASVQSQIIEKSRASAQANLFLGKIKEIKIPLPPLAEQKRIVAKVDELMQLCDQLEASLRQSQQRAESLAASAISHLTI